MRVDEDILLPRGLYTCEIMPFYLGVNQSKSGKCFGFPIYFKILEGDYSGRKIQDYIITSYSNGKYAKMENLKKISKALKLKQLSTNNLSVLEGRVINLLVDVKFNKDKTRFNYIEDYKC